MRSAAVPLVNSQRPCPLGPQVTGFRSYVDLYVKDKLDETGVALKVVNESVSDRWEVGLAMSEKGFQQVSFVNSIATTKVCYQRGLIRYYEHRYIACNVTQPRTTLRRL